MRSSWCDEELADSVEGDGEVPLQLSNAARKIARQPAGHHEPVRGERFVPRTSVVYVYRDAGPVCQARIAVVP